MVDGAPCRTDVVPDGICVDNACQMCTVDIEGCRALGWNSMTVPTGGSYDVVYAVGSGDAWAGGGTTLVHYDGAHWEPDTTFPALTGGVTITGITGTSSQHLFVGTNGSTIYHLVGGAWTPTTTNQIAHAVWAAGDDEAFAVGLVGDVEHYTGSAWAPMTSNTTATLAAVWGAGASNVYAAGKNGAVIHYDGSTWSAANAGSGSLVALWGTGSDVYAGGAGGIYHSVDGTTWTNQDKLDSVTSLWGDASSDLFAGTGSDILYSDGDGIWVPLAAPSALSVGGSGPADVFAATGTAILHYTGACWSQDLAAPSYDFKSAWAVPGRVFVAAENDGVLAQFDGASWTTVAMDLSWQGVWARSSSDAFAVGGGNSNTMIEHWDGSAWSSQIQGSNGFSFTAVGGNASTVYGTGEGLEQDNAGTWTVVGGAPSGLFNALWVASDGTVFLAGNGVSAYANGTSATSLPDGAWNAVWGLSSSDVYVAGASGQVRHFDGTAWSPAASTGTTAMLSSVWGTSDDDVFAAGDGGTLIHFHAGLWSTIAPPTASFTGAYDAVTGVSSSIYVVGPGGVASRLIQSAP